jgi:hypothetical protein
MSDRIILFRFHKDFENARERIKILRYFNPELPVYGMYGGPLDTTNDALTALADHLDGFWVYPIERDNDWKWMHTDLMTKMWFREVGNHLKFSYLYSYEYDLLTLAPLIDVYPEVGEGEIALSAAEPFTKAIENQWYWTSREPSLSRYKDFCVYMKEVYGLGRQKSICLGPGPLLSREFIEKYSATEDVDFMHEEINFPAFAEVFGIPIKNNGMHPGLFANDNDEKYFNCREDKYVQWNDVVDCILKGHSRRSFHPVKETVSLVEVENLMNKKYRVKK